MKNFFFLLLCFGLLAACKDMDNGSSKGKLADNKQMVQAFYDQVINAHNVAMIDSFTHPDFLDHNPDPGFSGKGSAELKTSFAGFFAAFPDVHVTTNFMVAEGDTVVSHVRMTGTNTGSMGPGMPATNKKISIEGIDIVSIKDGKAVERWGFFDTHKFMEDLGLMAGPPMDTVKMEKKGQ